MHNHMVESMVVEKDIPIYFTFSSIVTQFCTWYLNDIPAKVLVLFVLDFRLLINFLFATIEN